MIFNFESTFGPNTDTQSPECCCCRADSNNYRNKKAEMKLAEEGREGENRLLTPKAFLQNGETRDNVKFTK